MTIGSIENALMRVIDELVGDAGEGIMEGLRDQMAVDRVLIRIWREDSERERWKQFGETRPVRGLETQGEWPEGVDKRNGQLPDQ